MIDEDIIQLITLEFENKTLGVTEQYLEIHGAVYEDGKLKIDRIDKDGESDLIIVYLPVKNEYFYFAVYIDTGKKEIINIGTESRNSVSLRATSETFTSKELQSFTKLQSTGFWDKGDLKLNKRSTYNFSGIEFTPNPEPDEFEDKLKSLLSFLQDDKAGIVELTKNANAYIHVIMDFHFGNQFLGDATIDLESVKKLSELNLSISFDITAWGKPFR